MTKTELQGYRALEKEISQIRDQIRTLERDACSPRVSRLTGTPRAPSPVTGSAREDTIAAIMSLCDKYEARVYELIQQRQRIEDAIAALDNPDHRMILRARYIEGRSWRQIARRQHISEAQMYRLHGRAILEIAKY